MPEPTMPDKLWTFRPARREDADALVDFIEMAGDGLPEYLWARMARPGEDLRSVGRQRAQRNEGGFSWQNSIVAQAPDGSVAGGLIGYPLNDVPEPVDLQSVPPPVQPLVALEGLVPASWYINVIATRPAWRRRGLGLALLSAAQERAILTGRTSLSLIVSDGRVAARTLYEAQGFAEIGTAPKHPDGPIEGGSDWVLYRKPL